MRNKIYQSRFQTVEIDPENGFFFEIFHDDTAIWTEDLYKEDFLALREILMKVKTETASFVLKKGLIDMRKMFYTIAPELQIWHNENIFPTALAFGLQYMAILLSEDFIASLSVEQTINEANDAFQTRYFSDDEEALKWLS